MIWFDIMVFSVAYIESDEAYVEENPFDWLERFHRHAQPIETVP